MVALTKLFPMYFSVPPTRVPLFERKFFINHQFVHTLKIGHNVLCALYFYPVYFNIPVQTDHFLTFKIARIVKALILAVARYAFVVLGK